MKNKNLDIIAMFIILLLVNIPIYSSSVYAEINSVTSYGGQGIPNLVDRDYDLTVEASVSGSVSAQDIRLKSGPLAAPFDSCTGGNTSSLCTINIIRGINSELELCPQASLTVEQYDGLAYPISTKSIVVRCDSLPPTISLSSSIQQTNGQDVVLSYNIVDQVNSATQCSGVSRVEFYINSLSSGAATKETNTTSCSYSSSTSIPVTSYNDGNVVIYLKAYDRVGHSSITNISFTVDKTSPQAGASVHITDLNGNTLPYFTPQNVLADVVLNITDMTGVGSYSLDYSSITSSAPVCNNLGSNVVCRWDNIQMYMANASFTKNIVLTAVDTLGNNGSQTIAVQGTIVQDTSPPVITINDLNITTIDRSTRYWFRPGEMRLSFSADVTDDSSGIDSISGDFSSINLVSGDIPSCTAIDPNNYQCSWSNLIFNMDTASFNKEFRIIAKDKAGNEQTQTEPVTISFRDDSIGPLGSNFRVVKTSGANITGWIGDEIISARVSLDINEKGSGLESVFGDFSSLNPSYTLPLQGTCTQTSTNSSTVSTTTTSGIYTQYTSNVSSGNATLPETNYNCLWNINIHINQSGNPYNAEFLFNATDNSLNSVASSFSQAYQIDVDGPVVSSLATMRFFNGIYYIGALSNTYIAQVTDAGVGINNSDVYLDLTEVGFESNRKATSCSSGICYWDSLGCDVSEGEHTISVTTSTIDDLGNNLESSFSANVTLDKTYPVVNSISVTPVASSTQLYRDYIQTGNALYVIVNITEATSLLSATGDFSNFIMNETSDLADNCVRLTDNQSSQTDVWTCEWATDEIDIIQYNKANFFLNITDVAGNSLIYPHEIEVFEALTGDVDYWTNSVGSSSPNAIDRQLVTFYNPFMWFPVGLVSSEGLSASERWPLEVSVESCSGNSVSTNSSGNSSNSTSTSSVNYLSSANGNLPELVNSNTDSPTSLPYQMYMNYELEQQAPTEDSIDIYCLLKIRTMVDQQRISPYEYENVTVSIDYYNNALGTLDTNVQNEIDDVKGSWLVDASWIGEINQILTIAKSLCNLVSNLYQLTQIISLISDGLKVIPPTSSAGVALGGVSGALGDAVQGSWQSYVNGFCKFLNCQLFYGVDWGGEGNQGDTANNMLGNYGRWRERYAQFLNPRDSLIWSIIYLCIPGILYNLQKARVIECQYVRCLQQTAYGMPLQMCVRQRDYQWCSYVYGQVFNLIPFSGMFNQLMGRVTSMLSQPAELIGVGLSTICKLTCPTSKPCSPCIIMEGLSLSLDVLCDLGIGSDQCEPFWDSLTVDDSACDDI